MPKPLEVVPSFLLSPRIDSPITFRSFLNAFFRLSLVCFTISGLSLWVPFWEYKLSMFLVIADTRVGDSLPPNFGDSKLPDFSGTYFP